jgi:virginiamycin B lyase
MNRIERMFRGILAAGFGLWLTLAVVAAPTSLLAASSTALVGGAHGVVKNSKTGALLEGMTVQLVSHKTAIRTSVYTDKDGKFEFPKLATGWYLLRIARPLEFKPYQKDSVWVQGSPQLEDISLERMYEGEFLPPTPEIMAQLSDSEWLFNLPGTGYEKKLFSNACGSGCHTWHQSLRNRFDEKGWALMVNRMMTYATRLLIEPRTSRNPNDSESGFGLNADEQNTVLKFLQRVRGPNAEWQPMKAYPRPKGPATRVIITEYELPRFDVRPHDVVGDKDGNIWYTSNREPIIGKLNPQTGVVTEFKVPITPGKHTGQHWLDIGKDGKVVFTETWSNNLGLLDPRSGEITKIPGMGGNKGLAPDGFIWGTCGGAGGPGICKFDPKTAKPVEKYPLKKANSTYGNEVSADGRYFAGGDPWQRDFDGIVWMDLQTKEIYEVETPSQGGDPSRGGIDAEGNAWIGGRGGTLSMFDHKTHQVREFTPPTPYLTFYEAKPDKNGEVWAGAQRGGRMVRFNPKTDRWIEYQFPEPISLDWRTWVDNSTTPVSAWYGEHNGYIVRIQPLE